LLYPYEKKAMIRTNPKAKKEKALAFSTNALSFG
jgi:hypothetical protein